MVRQSRVEFLSKDAMDSIFDRGVLPGLAGATGQWLFLIRKHISHFMSVVDHHYINSMFTCSSGHYITLKL